MVEACDLLDGMFTENVLERAVRKLLLDILERRGFLSQFGNVWRFEEIGGFYAKDAELTLIWEDEFFGKLEELVELLSYNEASVHPELKNNGR